MARKAYRAERGIAIGPYSHAVEAGELVFLSGQTPLDPDTGVLVEGGIGEQTAQCLANLKAVLATAGLGFEHVVKVNVFLTDMANFNAMNRIYRDAFQEPYPARSTVGVAALPAGAAIEIEMIARAPARSVASPRPAPKTRKRATSAVKNPRKRERR
jgi:2-iminobutanoate/2-iminopropanoate deaminase